MKYRVLLISLSLMIGAGVFFYNHSIQADSGSVIDSGAGTTTTQNKEANMVPSYFNLEENILVELPGNPQKAGFIPDKNVILVPAKDMNFLYYITLIDGKPLLNNFTIPTGKGPVDVVVSNNGNRAYVANETDQTVTILNLDEEDTETVANIDIGGKPNKLALSKDNKYLYVLNKDNEDAVVAIKLNDDKSEIVNVIPVGEGASSIKISDNGNTAYVVNRGENTITEIDLTSPEGSVFKKSISVGVYPTDIAVNKDGNIALVTNGLDNDISLFDPSENPSIVFGNITGIAKPFGVEVDADDNIALVMSYYTGNINTYNLAYASQRLVSALEQDPIRLQVAKPEYMSINPANKVLAITHPSKDMLSIVRYNVDKREEIPFGIGSTQEATGQTAAPAGTNVPKPPVPSVSNAGTASNQQAKNKIKEIDNMLQNW